MRAWAAGIIVVSIAGLLLVSARSQGTADERLARHRNLGKAFYENPTTQKEAVEEFRKALELAPDSPRERLNYALALLAAGRTQEGIAELENVQKQDPKLPHAWFNLGVQYKKLGEFEKAARQFEGMIKLVPDEPVSHYNLGTLYKLANRNEDAVRHFETASKLDPNLAAPHFQLFNMYRQMGRRDEAQKRLQLFQEAKKLQENSPTPEDMEWSFYSEIYDIVDPGAATDDIEPAQLRFSAKDLARGVDAVSSGITLLDATGDGRTDVLVWSADGALLFRHGSERIHDAGLGALKNIRHAAPGDFNNDGLMDLCMITDEGPVLLANTKKRFERRELPAPAGSYESAVWIDYDHDYDQDLMLLGPKPVLLRNQGEAGFTDQTASFPFVSGHALSGIVFRVVADSKAIDLAVAYKDRSGVLYRDRLGGKYEATDLDAAQPGAVFAATGDYDHNGSLDLLAHESGKALLFRNINGRFSRVELGDGYPEAADLENRAIVDIISGGAWLRNRGEGRYDSSQLADLPEAARWKAADLNADGKLDLIAVHNDGRVRSYTNSTAQRTSWVRVGLKGVKNLKLAPGSEVEVKAGIRYQKLIYQGVPLHFGLRNYSEVDTVRITWPNGLIQSEAKQPANRTHTYEEAQRLSGSCPMIWTWNGREFEYITDVLGVAPLGASAGNGEYFAVDHLEHVFIPSRSIASRDGYYEIRITEELSEVAYIDQVRLIAVDRPAGTEIFLNEKFQGPPYPPLRLYGARERLYPVTARDHRGRNVRFRILKLDGVYPDAFARRENGIAEMHHLEIDFGPAAALNNRAALILHGWVDWADGSTFLGHGQETKTGLITPYLQVKDAAGNWVTVLDDMGMPAGKPKTIAVDLAGKFLSRDRSVRIVTNLCVYWDEIFLTEDSGEPETRRTTLLPAKADLRFRGFSKHIVHPERKQPEKFLYPNPSSVSMWNPTPGFYTRYGPVEELLGESDDRFVVMGSGDELRLLFDADALAPLPKGWQRDYILAVDGWAKDRDANTAYSQTVEPLPFHGMSRYPYPDNEKFPDTPIHREWRQKYQTRPALRLLRPLVEVSAR
jgi:Flp pilus assembly protein TadD